MCGIAGYIGRRTIDQARIERCLEVMRHRGPDAAGAYRHVDGDGRHVHLLHRRLSIIDLHERANQPLRQGDHVLVFNGELYNYREIRRTRGWTNGALRTQGDTEIMLRVLIEGGPEGLAACEGMWALACYDERSGTLLLARDRFGEKPLYLYRAPHGLYFASEAKFIFTLLGETLPVNRDQVCRFLVNGYKALYKNGTTFFGGLSELAPGAALVLHRDGRETRPSYWRPRCEPDDDMTRDDAVDAVRQELIRSVELRLRADVPVAFCLSGGVDSNALVSIARNVLDRDVHAFTIVNRDARYDERDLVDHAVNAQGLRHTAIDTDTSNFLDRLRALVRQHDAPVYTISYYAQWLLIRAMADHGYRISISGTGADELFTGYYDHHNAYLYEVRNDVTLHAAARAAWETHIRPIVRNPHLANPDLFAERPDFRDHIFLDREEFARWLVQPWEEPFTEARYSPGLLRNRMLNELFHESVPPILHEDDHNAMSRSIENRSPYLDRDLFELAQRIPTRHLVRDGYAKSVLRDAMRSIVPDPILDERRKVGFNVPIDAFIDRKDPEVRAVVLDDGPIFDIVRREAVVRLLDADELTNSRSKFLFSFLSTRMFLEEFAATTP